MAQARVSVHMYDGIGGIGTFLTHATIADSTTMTAANAALATLVTNLATLSTGGVSEATLTLVNRAVAAAPGADPNIQSGANFGFRASPSTSRFGQYIPSFLDSLILPGGAIDTSSGAPAAWIAYMLAAFLGGNFANSEYVSYSAGVKAFRSNRKLRNVVR